MKFVKKTVSFLLAALMLTATTPQLSAWADLSVTAYAAEDAWNSTYNLNNCSTFTVDSKTVYGDNDHSVRVTNKDYNVAGVRYSVDVKKNTKYSVTVWARTNVCTAESGKTSGGALLVCKTDNSNVINSSWCNSKDWKKLEVVIDSKSSTKLTVQFSNGYSSSYCKGTAWFSRFEVKELADWDATFNINKCSTFTVDTKTAYDDYNYSIRITNKNYNMAGVKYQFDVKKNTKYRVTAWAKTNGCTLDPNKKGIQAGALLLGKTATDNVSCYTNKKDWKKLEFIIDSKDNTQLTVQLCNGYAESYNKGTVWFSSLRVEEMTGKPDNEWNVLGIVFKNVEAPIIVDGKETIYKDSLNDEDVKAIRSIFEQMYTSIPLMSEDLWKIQSIDVYATDSVVDELKKTGGTNYSLGEQYDCVSDVLDMYIEKAEKESGKRYNQIIMIAPLDGVMNGVAGYGDRIYNGIKLCEYKYVSGSGKFSPYGGNNMQGGLVHEMLHCVEGVCEEEYPDVFQIFHGYQDVYAEEYTQNLHGWNYWGAWQSDYMRCTIDGGKGVHANCFLDYNRYDTKVIYGSENEPYTKTDVSTLTISKPKSYAYTGKPIKPTVIVKDGSKTLAKGKDYKLTYVNNTEIGRGAVIVEGMGNYTGKYAQTFNIVPKKTTLNVKKTTSSYKLSWTAVSGADKYQIYYSTNGGKSYKLLKTLNGAKTSANFRLDASKEYIFKIRSYTEIYPQKFYSSFSSTVKA